MSGGTTEIGPSTGWEHSIGGTCKWLLPPSSKMLIFQNVFFIKDLSLSCSKY
jgi:hypothetical protein